MEAVKEVTYGVLVFASVIFLVYAVIGLINPKVLPWKMKTWSRWANFGIILVVLAGFGLAEQAVMPESLRLEREAEQQAKEEAREEAALAEREARYEKARAETRARNKKLMEAGDAYNALHPPGTESLPPSGKQLTRIVVPSDPSAKYWYFDLNRLGGGKIHVSTKRIGSSGTSYAKRVIDCDRSQWSYLKDADSWSEFINQSSMSIRWGPFVDGSISFWVAYETCQKAGYVR
ncbi:MAG: hypothetical protein VXW22_15565 [Pseudomonadota bacterium]|nr:hypothetical protein [Pseudomonadota bacterium]